jgi:hypothetical protein
MGKHETGFARVERDFYPTPSWVTEALGEHVDLAGKRVWEPACGDGRMSEVLKALGASVFSSDVEDRGYSGTDALLDFLVARPPQRFDGIVTNPPYGLRAKLAEKFIQTGLRHIADGGFLALLLSIDFDSATRRPRFFADCPAFTGKIVLTERVVWYANPDPRRENPKENTAWFIWSSPAPLRVRQPVIMYSRGSRGDDMTGRRQRPPDLPTRRTAPHGPDLFRRGSRP